MLCEMFTVSTISVRKWVFLSQLQRAPNLGAVLRTGVLAGAAVWRTCGERPLRSDCPLPNAERYHGVTDERVFKGRIIQKCSVRSTEIWKYIEVSPEKKR